jgi:hypothetical protein
MSHGRRSLQVNSCTVTVIEEGHPWPAALLTVYTSKQEGSHLKGVSMDPVSNKVCDEVLQYAQSLL